MTPTTRNQRRLVVSVANAQPAPRRPASKKTASKQSAPKKAAPKRAAPKITASRKKNPPKSPKRKTGEKRESFPADLLLSPTDPVAGELVPHRADFERVLWIARQWSQKDVVSIQPFGFANPGYLCYFNSIITMLINLPAFVGYLNRVNGPHTMAEVRDQEQELILSERGTLARLDEIANTYWSGNLTNKKDKRNKQKELDRLSWDFWTYTMNVQAPYGCSSFLPFKKTDAHQDAGDYADTIFEIITTQLRARVPDTMGFAVGFESLFIPLLQPRIACPGAGTTCPNHKERRLLASRGDDPILKLYLVNGNTLEECIAASMKDTLEDNDVCPRCTIISNGRYVAQRWFRFRENPEILFMRVFRFYKNRSKSKKRLSIPEHLDLNTYLEPEDRDGGATANYRLDAVVSHTGTANRGHYIIYVRDMTDKDIWYQINDTKVIRSSYDRAVDDSAKGGKSQWTPVVLAYTKVQGTVQQQRRLVVDVKGGPRNAESTTSVPPVLGPTEYVLAANESKNHLQNDHSTSNFLSSTASTPSSASFRATLFPIDSDSALPLANITQNIPNSDWDKISALSFDVEIGSPENRRLHLEGDGEESRYVLRETREKEVERKHEPKPRKTPSPVPKVKRGKEGGRCRWSAGKEEDAARGEKRARRSV